MLGNMGSEKRFNYSAMGDVVNVAARIESATKSFGVDILISEEVAAAVPAMALLEAGEILLKGKSQPSKLFALVGGEDLDDGHGKRQHAAVRSLGLDELRDLRL